MNKRGFTLMELMVYMAIVGIVVVIAGQVYSDSTKMRVRTQGMIMASHTVEDAGNLIRDDIAQMGAKSAKDGSNAFLKNASVYMDPANVTPALVDSSSFRLKNSSDGKFTDTLVSRRMHYSEEGLFQSIEEIAWFRNGRKLMRHCRTLSGKASGYTVPADCPEVSGVQLNTSVEIVDNVDSFKVVPSKPQVLSTETVSADDLNQILPSADKSVKNFRLVPRYGVGALQFVNARPENGGSSITLSGFASNYDYEHNQPTTEKNANQVVVAEANGASGSWSDLCKKVTLDANQEYEISFKVPFVENESRMFCPGRDYAAVGFIDMEGNHIDGLPDYQFYFSTEASEIATRTFRFSVRETVSDVCMAFTFANYSPIVSSGSVVISDVTLNKVAASGYEFDDALALKTTDKKNVRAFKLSLTVRKRDASGKGVGEPGSTTRIIPVPSNGPRN